MPRLLYHLYATVVTCAAVATACGPATPSGSTANPVSVSAALHTRDSFNATLIIPDVTDRDPDTVLTLGFDACQTVVPLSALSCGTGCNGGFSYLQCVGLVDVRDYVAHCDPDIQYVELAEGTTGFYLPISFQYRDTTISLAGATNLRNSESSTTVSVVTSQHLTVGGGSGALAVTMDVVHSTFTHSADGKSIIGDLRVKIAYPEADVAAVAEDSVVVVTGDVTAAWDPAVTAPTRCWDGVCTFVRDIVLSTSRGDCLIDQGTELRVTLVATTPDGATHIVQHPVVFESAPQVAGCSTDDVPDVVAVLSMGSDGLVISSAGVPLPLTVFVTEVDGTLIRSVVHAIRVVATSPTTGCEAAAASATTLYAANTVTPDGALAGLSGVGTTAASVHRPELVLTQDAVVAFGSPSRDMLICVYVDMEALFFGKSNTLRRLQVTSSLRAQASVFASMAGVIAFPDGDIQVDLVVTVLLNNAPRLDQYQALATGTATLFNNAGRDVTSAAVVSVATAGGVSEVTVDVKERVTPGALSHSEASLAAKEAMASILRSASASSELLHEMTSRGIAVTNAAAGSVSLVEVEDGVTSELPPKEDDSGTPPVWMYAVAGLGGLLVIAAVALFVVCCVRRCENKLTKRQGGGVRATQERGANNHISYM